MSEIASALSLPHEFEFEGKTLKVAPRDFEIEGAFELWLERRALQKIQQHADSLSMTEYAMQMDGWRRECASSVYAYGGMDCWRALVTPVGQKQMCFLQLNKGMGRADMNLVEKLFASDQGWERFKEVQKLADSDPTKPMPWVRKTA